MALKNNQIKILITIHQVNSSSQANSNNIWKINLILIKNKHQFNSIKQLNLVY